MASPLDSDMYIHCPFAPSSLIYESFIHQYGSNADCRKQKIDKKIINTVNSRTDKSELLNLLMIGYIYPNYKDHLDYWVWGTFS